MAEADDVNSELLSGHLELLGKRARRSATSLLAVSHDHDYARFLFEVEHLGRLLYGRSERCLARRHSRVDRAHDGLGSPWRRWELDLDVALVVRPRPVGDETDSPELRDARQDLSQGRAH